MRFIRTGTPLEMFFFINYPKNLLVNENTDKNYSRISS